MVLYIDKDKTLKFRYWGQVYDLQSHPDEPCTDIMKDGEILRILRHGFETAEIETLLAGGAPLRSMQNREIDQKALCEVLAAALEDGRMVLDFDYAETLAERHRQKLLTAKGIPAERQSVSMGDDCHAPHRTELPCCEDTLLSELLGETADYVPPMRDVVWTVLLGEETVGWLISDGNTEYTCRLAGEDRRVAELSGEEIFCRYGDRESADLPPEEPEEAPALPREEPKKTAVLQKGREKTMEKIKWDNRAYLELFVVQADGDKHTATAVGQGADGTLLLIEEEEYHVGNAYAMAREFFLLDRPMYLQYLIQAVRNGRVTPAEMEKLRQLQPPQPAPAKTPPAKERTACPPEESTPPEPPVPNSYRVIDMESWDRAMHCKVFRDCVEPAFCVTFSVDVTDFRKKVRELGLSFTLAMVYAVCRCANRVEAFRYRFLEGQVVLYNRIDTAFPYLNQETGLFKVVNVPMIDGLEDYCALAARTAQNQKAYFTGPLGNDVFQCSALPWVSFSHISHTNAGNRDNATPLFDWGRYEEREGRLLMPLSVQAHHSFVDGLHIGQLAEELNTYLASFSAPG